MLRQSGARCAASSRSVIDRYSDYREAAALVFLCALSTRGGFADAELGENGLDVLGRRRHVPKGQPALHCVEMRIHSVDRAFDVSGDDLFRDGRMRVRRAIDWSPWARTWQ